MSTVPPDPSTSASHSNFVSIFNAALETYKRKTKKDLASHPLLPSLQSCESSDAVLTVLREQIPAFSQSQNIDDRLTKWVSPTVKVLYSFSATVGGSVGLVNTSVPSSKHNLCRYWRTPLAYVDTHGSQAAKDVSSSQDKLFELLNRIEHFFLRLEIYTGITPTSSMRDIIIEIMVEVVTILAIATKEAKRGRLKKYMKKLIGNTEIEDSLAKLDKLTQEEARMASAELLKVTHGVDNKVVGVDDRVKDVEGKVQGVRGDVQDVHHDVQDVGNKVQGVDHRVQGIDNDVRIANNKLDHVNRSLSL
ncbi:hypothetical protein DFH94DRAFT_841607 [Russula ochroleuca]|uniref:Uncharacterized protein n=1 Tax=Russula ochroleuca TaxID=152965 RepID=A0A9P5N6W3_9AGAM|nr:hypothetical protein DFH94DRAFT_841607 [Russula ochroleuca]